VNITTIMYAHQVNADSDLSSLDNAISFFRAWETFSDIRNKHWVQHREWLPFDFYTESEKFFGGRYSTEQIEKHWAVACDYLHPEFADDEADEAMWQGMSDEQKAILTQMGEEVGEFVARRRTEREHEQSVLNALEFD